MNTLNGFGRPLEHSSKQNTFYILMSKSLNLFYTIERRKVKYPRVIVYPDQSVKFVIPVRFPERNVQIFIRDHEPWVQKKLAQFAKPREKFIHLKPGEILFFGEPFSPDFSGDRKALIAFYRKSAKEYLTLRTAELATKHGFIYSKLSITSAKTRWGSCSSKKNISFSYLLIKAPAHIIDYVILHELAHTKILNHSPSFWKKVAEICPGYKEAKNWLKKYGRELE
jgi:predicted metal-dependent hydrolase